MPNDQPKRTSFKRYCRVSDILLADNLLRTKLSKNMAAVCRPDQTHEKFPIEVVYVTDEIHKQGLDVFNVPKIEVIKLAHRLLVKNPGPIPMPAPPAPEPKAPKPVKVKAKAKPKPKPKPKPRPKRSPVPKGPATADASPAAVEQKLPGGTEGNGPASITLKATPFVRPHFPFVLGVAAMSNLQGAALLLESANDAELRDTIQKLNDVIDDLQRRTILPPSVEKESAIAG